MLSPEIRGRLIEAARALATERGWPWIEPVDIRLSSGGGDRTWSIRTNAESVGMNVRILIRESDAAILLAAYLPR